MISRVREDFAICRDTPPEGVQVGLVENNIAKWWAKILGPPGTPYEGGRFVLSIDIPDTFPATRPIVKFVTKIYHPNIKDSGEICLSVLNTWNRDMKIDRLLVYIMGLLITPNGNSPYRTTEILTDPPTFNRKARESTLLNACKV